MTKTYIWERTFWRNAMERQSSAELDAILSPVWSWYDEYDQPRPQGLLAFQYGGDRREDPGTQQKSRDWFVHGEWKFIQNGGQDKEWEDLGTRSWDWRKTNKMAAKANAREAKNMKECT